MQGQRPKTKDQRPKTDLVNLENFLRDCAVAVEAILDEIVPSETVEPTNLHRAMRWSLFAGGKRFRPALMLATGETFGARRADLLKTAGALEMIHTYSLIHDDLPAMDDDDWRRGRQTCHKKFDEATAILAGDALQTLAFEVVAGDANLSFEKRVRLIQEIARAAGTPVGMIAGQVFDLRAEKTTPTAIQLEQIHRAKTGALIAVAARAGAIIADAAETELQAVTDYAANLGLLFQITDDLLDISGTIENLGKTPGKDERGEKATYPALYGVEKTRELAQTTHQNAVHALETLTQDSILLHEIADYAWRRNK